MNLPVYLKENKERILNAAPQQIFMWNSSYDKFRNYKVIDELYQQFPDKNLQRKDVVAVMKADPYKGFIAAMLWGGINATKPVTKGDVDTPLYKLMQFPEEKVVDAIEHARKQIISGNLINLFTDFAPGGKHKLPGIDAAYFTKLFYFLGEAENDNTSLKPLIWDKWTSNAHCSLLIQLAGNNLVIPYSGINKHVQYSVNLPQNQAKAKLYQQYVEDFNQWASDVGVSPSKLEEFVFGQSLKQNKQNGNPRIDLWKVIVHHFNGEIEIEKDKSTFELKPKPTKPNKIKAFQMQPVEELNQGTKYYALQEFFKRISLLEQKEVNLSVDKIEEIIGSKLPNWAFSRKESFWSNSGYSDHIQKRAWLSQGYRVTKCIIDDNSLSGEIKFLKTLSTE